MRSRNWGALTLGVLFALGTCWVLFNDVRSPSQITVDHVSTLLVLLGTITSGHMFGHQARELHVLRALGLASLFIAGTGYCVTQSAARNAEVAVAKTVGIENANATRKKLDDDIAEAKVEARASKKVADTECRSGEGARCKSTTKTAERADSHYWLLTGRLANMRGEQVADAGTKHAAKVFASLPWVTADAAAIERTLVLTTPFLKALFLEIATLVFFGIGLHRREATISQGIATAQGTTGETHAALPLRSLPSRSSFPRLALPSPKETHPVIAALEAARRPVANFELADLMDCSPGEASKRCREVAEQLRVVRQGKRFAITLAR